MKEKIVVFILVQLAILLTAVGFGATNLTSLIKSNSISSIAIMDVTSGYYDAGKTRLLTDMFRSELFKTKLFQIVDRGVIQRIMDEQKLRLTGLTVDSDLLKLGKLLDIQKLFVCSIEKFSDTLAVNIRIIDVNTSLVDYSEIVFVKDENKIFDALIEIVNKITLFYSVQKTSGAIESSETKLNILKLKWGLLGAKDNDMNYALDNHLDLEEYMNLRQYDITFTVSEFIKVKKNAWDTGMIRNFLQTGISYELTEKAIALGITKLDPYNQHFKVYGISFEDYLEAYANKIMTYEEFKIYKEGFRKSRFILGLGGVSDQIPIASANFRFLIADIGWEYFWTKYQRDTYKFSTELGFFMNWLVLPVPYAQFNAYFGSYPFYLRASAGVLADPLIGGHAGVFGSLGVEIMETYSFNFIVATGSQPYVSYTDFITRPANGGKWFVYDPNDFGEIKFPYFGVTFTYKL